MAESPPLARRRFLRCTAGLLAPYFVPRTAFGANDRVGVGHIGINWMGGAHLGHYAHHKTFPTVAVCDCDAGHLTKAKKRVGQHCKAYEDFRHLLDDKDVDAVVIATPDHWHAPIVVRAARAGKDIYCEKPLSLTIREARAMVSAVRRHGVVFQTGSQQRSRRPWRQFGFACECVRSGRIGKVHTINVGVGGASGPCHLAPQPVPKGLDWDMWLGPAPVGPYHSSIHPVRWRAYFDYSGGSFTDIGAHHFDIAQWGIGMETWGPTEVHPPDGKEYKQITFKYANGIVMYHGGARGIKWTGTDGWVEVSRGHIASQPAEIVQTPLAPNEVRLYHSPEHHADWEHCVRTRRRPVADVEIGARTITVCHLGNIAYWLRRALKWDPAKEEILGDPEAARWLDRPRRGPWYV